MSKRAVYVVIAMLLYALRGPSVAIAQPAADPQLVALIQKVQELERTLAEVKAELSRRGTPSTVAVPPVDAATIAAAAVPAADPNQPDAHTLGPLQFRGYGDFRFGRSIFEKLPPGGLAGSTQTFTLGDFDLFVTAQLSSHLSMLGEMLVTSDFTNNFGSEIDRFMLTYKANQYFQISAGKYNTGISYYTNAFHRAFFFQTATGKPIMYGDEDNGGILPVHSIGLTATGVIPSGGLGLHWVAELANGRAASDPEAVPVQNYVDENNGKAVNVALYARPESLRGFEIGGSFYRDRLHPPGIAALNQRIYSAHVVLVRPHTEALAEGAMVHHEDALTHRTYNSVTSYGQLSHEMGIVRPYVRYDYQNVSSRDPIFGALRRTNGPSVGLRFSLGDFAVLKFQYGRLSLMSGKPTNDVQAQLAFAF